MNCPNCGKTLSCGCQKRVASDGNQVCTSCIGAYEINKNKQATAIVAQNDFIVVANSDPNLVDPVVNGLEIQYNNFEK